MKTLEVHPEAALLHKMPEVEFNNLCADIAANGLVNPITMYEGKILDGCTRYAACQRLGIDLEDKDFREIKLRRGQTIASYVISANLHGRKYTVGQKAAYAAKLANWYETKVLATQKEAGKKGGKIGGRGNKKGGTDIITTLLSRDASKRSTALAAKEFDLPGSRARRDAERGEMLGFAINWCGC